MWRAAPQEAGSEFGWFHVNQQNINSSFDFRGPGPMQPTETMRSTNRQLNSSDDFHGPGPIQPTQTMKSQTKSQIQVMISMGLGGDPEACARLTPRIRGSCQGGHMHTGKVQILVGLGPRKYFALGAPPVCCTWGSASTSAFWGRAYFALRAQPFGPRE